MASSPTTPPPPPMKLLSIAFLLTILLQYNIVVAGARDISAIKTVRTEEGDVFDCIDINKQPSLDHHLLKNHVVMVIGDDDNDNEPVVSSSSSSQQMAMLMRKLDCPDGTVPIHRTSKKDLKSFSKLQQLFSSINNNIGDQFSTDYLDDPGQGHFLSIAKTRKDSGIEYSGIQAFINIYNPPVSSEEQISSSQLWIENGTPEQEFNSLEAGWIVAPFLFGDNKTRLFAKWQIESPNKGRGCYNIMCDGFIQVNKDYPLGNPILTISQYGGSVQFDTKVAISKDGSGNWWLEVQDIKIGYWPFELGFSQLTRGSSVIAWGGLAAQLGTETTTIPPTGNGHYPIDSGEHIDFRRSCYMRQMKVIPSKGLNWEDPTRQIIDTIETNKKCSIIRYYGQLDHKLLQHTLVFGGPGGNCS